MNDVGSSVKIFGNHWMVKMYWRFGLPAIIVILVVAIKKMLGFRRQL